MLIPDSAMLSIYEPNMGAKRGQRTGHLYSKSGNWMLRYYVDSAEIDPETGRPLRDRITVTVCKSKGADSKTKREAARMAWENILCTLDAAHTRPSSAKTFGEFVGQRFQPDVVQNLKPTGQAFYGTMLRRHILPYLGSTPLRQISVAQIQGILNLKAKQGLSTQTVVHVRNCISAVLRHAKAMSWFHGELPTTAVRLPEMKREARRAMTWEQVCRLARALPEPCATLTLFLALTGLRIGEAMGLRWKRLNLTPEPIQVDAEIIPPYSVAVRESFVMGRYQTLKTTGSGRNVPIPEWFAPRLIALRSGDPNGQLAVFANGSRSAPIDQHNLASRVLKPIAKSLEMPWVSWHVFRHSNATMMDGLGLTTAERMKVLGHSLAATTMDYTHPEYQGIVEKMGKLPKLLQ